MTDKLDTTEIHKITTIESIKKFMLAGNATFTLESERTGRWFTYQINKRIFEKEVNGETIESIFYFVSVLTGTDNESSYSYLGSIFPNFNLVLTKKSRITKDALSYKAINFFVSNLRKNHLHKELNFYHQGFCGKCGRTLTTPLSVATGLGPICAGYNEPSVAKKRKKKLQNLNKVIMANN